jgi:hypothetical protein
MISGDTVRWVVGVGVDACVNAGGGGGVGVGVVEVWVLGEVWVARQS